MYHASPVDLIAPRGNITFSGVVTKLTADRVVLHTRLDGVKTVLYRVAAVGLIGCRRFEKLPGTSFHGPFRALVDLHDHYTSSLFPGDHRNGCLGRRRTRKWRPPRRATISVPGTEGVNGTG